MNTSGRVPEAVPTEHPSEVAVLDGERIIGERIGGAYGSGVRAVDGHDDGTGFEVRV